MDITNRMIEENQKAVKARWELKTLCSEIIEASLYWTGDDEEKNPFLKKIRTLARYYLELYDYAEKPIETQDKEIK